MKVEKGIPHRPGVFKQSNKEHKHGRHRSKGSINKTAKGKVASKTISKKLRKELSKHERRQRTLQIWQRKTTEVAAKKRSLGGLENAPFQVSIIPLSKSIDCNTSLNILMQCDEEAIINKTLTGITHIAVPRFKQRFAFIVPPTRNQFAVLDALKVSDTVLFLISAATGLDDEELLIDNWRPFTQELPTPIVAITDLESIAPKKRNEQKQAIQKLVNKWLPEEKVMVLDKNVDGVNILRRIGNQKRKSLIHRDRRPHLLAEEIEYISKVEGGEGTLKVTGYLRGTTLSVNQLIYIPGLMDFQMLQIDARDDPNRVIKRIKGVMDLSEKVDIKVLEESDADKQEKLCLLNAPSLIDVKPIWRSNEEIGVVEQEQKVRKMKKVPKGWSDYQAAWIPDDDAEFQLDDGEGSENEYLDAMSEDGSENSNEGLDAMSEDGSENSNHDLNAMSDDDENSIKEDDSEVAPNDEQYDKEMDVYAEKEALAKLKAAKINQQFPDEIDTPMDQPARIRFQKYRALESFRTSPWDPNENLPFDYTNIYKFANFDRTRKKILKEQEDREGVKPGLYITIHIKDVPQDLWTTFEKTNFPLVIIGLLPHETNMSVVNTVLRRTPNYELPIKSKERLIFQYGYRRCIGCPIFSTHTNGQRHKYERFFQPGSTMVASFYAPVQYPPAPVLCFKAVGNDAVLVATGNLLSCNPDRMVIKRVVLSGHPLKIHKRSAVIRFMFFNREDVLYFKPCKLRTKMGRTGHIKEPLGTHGHMKCVFDGQLKSQDTVLLNLYKRVFPRWHYANLLYSLHNSEQNMDTT